MSDDKKQGELSVSMRMRDLFLSEIGSAAAGPLPFHVSELFLLCGICYAAAGGFNRANVSQ